MQRLQGLAAKKSIETLLASTSPVLTLALDPFAQAALAIATTERAILITPEPDALRLLIQANKPLCAYNAKDLHRFFYTHLGFAPNRWACIHISEQLLLGGRKQSLHIAAIAQRYSIQLDDPTQGFEAFLMHTQGLAKIIEAQSKALKASHMQTVSRIEALAVAPTSEMEIFGMPCDLQDWRDITKHAANERTHLKEQILKIFVSSPRDLFNHATLNIDNDNDLKQALGRLGHYVPNVRLGTVAHLPEPLGPSLVRYRELNKLISTYGESFLQHIGHDNRIHPTFEQIGTTTGRMACRAPNLQAVVKSSAYRQCFRAPLGKQFVIGDYATCELRILAEMSGDPVFTHAFFQDEDLHARVATSMFGKYVSKIENPELRQRAKAVNFGLIYGMGAIGLARTLKVSENQGRELLQRYFTTFPKIKSYLNDTAQMAVHQGFAQTLAGRRMYLEGFDEAGQAARLAKNMPIQGTSADITKTALGRLRSRLTNARIVNAVHDEIVVECDTNDAESIAKLVRNEMQAAGQTLLKTVPLKAEVEITQIWNK